MNEVNEIKKTKKECRQKTKTTKKNKMKKEIKRKQKHLVRYRVKICIIKQQVLALKSDWHHAESYDMTAMQQL